MNWPNENPKIFKMAALLFGCLVMLGCGVKGDPLPPDRPVELGRGRPTYKRATEGLTIEKTKPRKEEDEDEDDER